MPENKTFPRDFKWGTATSSYQIEGAPTAGGKGPSVWDSFSHIEGKINNGDTGDTACDHYHLWRDDIGLLKKLGVNAYRFSISWPRIFPTGKENEPNQIGLDFYSRLVDTLLENQITPFITLNHWDIPQGLEDIGGWTERNIVHDFVKYSYHVSKHLGDRVRNWITHNEPWCISYLGYIEGHKPPGLINNWSKSLATAHHLLLSHGMAIPEIRNNSKQSEVGITLNLNTAIPASGSTHDEDACRTSTLRSASFFPTPPKSTRSRVAGMVFLGLNIPVRMVKRGSFILATPTKVSAAEDDVFAFFSSLVSIANKVVLPT